MFEEGLTIPYSDLSPRVSDVALIICGSALRNIHNYLMEEPENCKNILSKEKYNALVECCAWYLTKLSFYSNCSDSNCTSVDCNENNSYLLDEDEGQIRSNNKRKCNSVIELRKDCERQKKRQKTFEKDFYSQICVTEKIDQSGKNDNNYLDNENESNNATNTFSSNDVNFPMAVNTLVLPKHQHQNEEEEQEKQWHWSVNENKSLESEVQIQLHKKIKTTEESIDAGLQILFELLSETSTCCGVNISRKLAVEMIDLLSVNRWIHGIIDNIEKNNSKQTHLVDNKHSHKLANTFISENKRTREEEVIIAELEINISNSLTTLSTLLESDNIEHESLYAFGSLTCGFNVWVKVAWSCASFRHQCEVAHQVSQWCKPLLKWIQQSYVNSLQRTVNNNSLESAEEEGELYHTDKSLTTKCCNESAQIRKTLNKKSESELLFLPRVIDVTFMRQQLRNFITGSEKNYWNSNSINSTLSLRVNPHHFRHLIIMEESMLLYLSHVSCALLPSSTPLYVFIDLLIANSPHRQSTLTNAECDEDGGIMWGSFQTATKPILERVAHGLLIRAMLCLMLHSFQQAEECVQTVMFITHQLHSRVLSALTHYCRALLFMMCGQANKACESLTVVLELCKGCLSSSHVFINNNDNAIPAQDVDYNDGTTNSSTRTDGNNVNRVRSHSNSTINATRQTNRVNDTHVSSIGVNEDANECENEKMDAIWANNVQKEELQRILSGSCLTLAQLLILYPGAIPSEMRVALMSMQFHERTFNSKYNGNSSANNYRKSNGMNSESSKPNIKDCTWTPLSKETHTFAHVNLYVYGQFVEHTQFSAVENESEMQRVHSKTKDINNTSSSTTPPPLTTETIAQATQHLLHLSQITAESDKHFLTLSQPLLVTSYYPACLLSIHNINCEIIRMQSSIYGVACSPLHFNTHAVMKEKELIDSHVFVSDIQRQMMHQLLLNAMATHVAQYVLCMQHDLLMMHDTTSLNELITFMTAVQKCYGRSGQDWLNEHTFFTSVLHYIWVCRLQEQGYTRSAYEAICALLKKLLRIMRYSTNSCATSSGTECTSQMYISPEYLMLFALVQLTHANLCVIMDNQEKLMEISFTLAHISTSCDFAFGVIVSEYISLLEQLQHRADANAFTEWNTLIEKARAIGFTPLTSYILRSKVEWCMQESKWEHALAAFQLLSDSCNTLNSTWYKITWLNITCALLVSEYYKINEGNVNNEEDNKLKVDENNCHEEKLENLTNVVLTNLYYFNQMKVIGIQINEECHAQHTTSISNTQHIDNESMWNVKQAMKRDNELSCEITNSCCIALTFRELLCVHLTVEQVVTLLSKQIKQSPLFAVLFPDISSISTQTSLLLRTLRWRQEQKGLLEALRMQYMDKENDHYLLAMCKALQSNNTAQFIYSQQKH